MAVQGRVDNTNYPFLLSGRTVVREAETIAQDGGRGTTVLKRFTLMAQTAATGKWVPHTSLTALDGTNTARGIYMGDDIAGASLVAGDVLNCPILVGGDLATFDSSQLVIEGVHTLASVCSDTSAGADNGAVNVRQIADDLARIGLYAETTVDIDTLEN